MNPREGGRPPLGRGMLLALVVAAAVGAGVSALLVNIVERKQEGRNPYHQAVELTDDTEDPAI